LTLTGQIFIKFDITIFFKKSVNKIHVSLKSDKNNSTLHGDQNAFLVISHSLLLKIGKFLDKFVEKMKTISSSVTSKNHATYEKM
jgi:hypothetical protein